MTEQAWALSPLMTSARTDTGCDEWATPLEFIHAVEQKLNLTLQLDACCSAGNGIITRLNAAGVRRWGIEWEHPRLDGLRHPWASYCRSDYPDRAGAIWCNPPYSDCDSWLRKARAEGQHRPVVCLVPARTDTRWWTDHVMRPRQYEPDTAPHAGRRIGEAGAARVLFVVGRLAFLRPGGRRPGPAPFPSALILFAPYADLDPRVESWRWETTTQSTLL
ncbi:MAG: hypothetical protein KGO50_10580 [Myxococcales bacterium]|nr:hypothetical protein [Myxococcales bacterium]